MRRHLPPEEKAKALEVITKLHAKGEHTEEIANRVGMSVPWVYSQLKVLGLLPHSKHWNLAVGGASKNGRRIPSGRGGWTAMTFGRGVRK